MTRPLAPPSSAPLPLALDEACARIADVPHGLESLGDPDRCPLQFLPALAWTAGLEEWDPAWPEAVQRAEVKSAIPMARLRGTWGAVRRLLDGIGAAWTREEGPPDGMAAMTGRITIHNGDSLHGEDLAGVKAKIDRVKRLSFRLDIVIRSGISLELAPRLGAAPLAAGRVEVV